MNCACMLACACACTYSRWRPILIVLPPHFLRQSLSLNLEPTDWPDWLLLTFTCQPMSAPLLQTPTPLPGFYGCVGDLNLGSNTCRANTLQIKLSPYLCSILGGQGL